MNKKQEIIDNIKETINLYKNEWEDTPFAYVWIRPKTLLRYLEIIIEEFSEWKIVEIYKEYDDLTKIYIEKTKGERND